MNGNELGEQWANPQASEYVIIISYTHSTVLYFQYSLLMILLKSALLFPFTMDYFQTRFIVQFVNPNAFDGCIYDCVL